MNENNNIIWLASYPKSGNTWFRSFISALKNNSNVDINELDTGGIFSSKCFLENILDLDSELLTQEEIDAFKLLAWHYFSTESKEKKLIKIHDAINYSVVTNTLLIPQDASWKSIYIVRHPFDVAISLANHLGSTIDVAVDFVNSQDSFLANSKSPNNSQFQQNLGTWNYHVKSWKERASFPVLFIRYEDMKLEPFKVFKEAVVFLELDYNDETILSAIDASNFDRLKEQETMKGFKEKDSRTKSFFFKGEIGLGAKVLSPEQKSSICSANYEMMQYFGYL